ncbi:hypothetical protein TSMEX_009973, partial [Taenia solium]
VTHHESTENANDSGNLRARPQCIYEISRDQTYQFGDWFVLRSGNSSVIILQEYAALCIEVKLRQIPDYPVVPIIVATLFTRSDSKKGGETRATPEADQARTENLGELEAKTIILCSSAEGGQIRDNEGVIPLPLKCTHEKTSSPETLHGVCSTLLCERENKPLIQNTDEPSGKLDPEDGVCVTKKTSPASCSELKSEKKLTSAITSNLPSRSADDPLSMGASTPNQGNPSTSSLEHIWKRLRNTERDFASKENHESKTKVNQLDCLTAGLLSLSVSSSGLVVCLRGTGGAERYLKALATANNEVVACNHMECAGAFDPDFYQHFAKSWVDDQEEQRTAKQTLPDIVGLEKIIIAQSRSGGMRFFGTDGLLIYRANAYSRTAKLQK